MTCDSCSARIQSTAARWLPFFVKAFQFTTDKIVRRLIGIAVGAVLLDSIVTLFSRSAHFSPMRRGLVFLLDGSISIAAVFLIAFAVPRMPALAGLFALIFTHYFRASNLLLYQWSLDWVTLVYGATVAVLVALLVFPPADAVGDIRRPRDVGFGPDRIFGRLCWLMVAAWIFDKANTLLGQPATYWNHPETANEGYQLDRFFMVRCVFVYSLYQLTSCRAFLCSCLGFRDGWASQEHCFR